MHARAPGRGARTTPDRNLASRQPTRAPGRETRAVARPRSGLPARAGKNHRANALAAQVQIIITMRATTLALLVTSAAALKAPKQTALAVRGGGDDSTNEIIMKVSAAAATASGALTILDKSDLVEKYIFFGLNPATSGAAYGVALLGWGVGKINAVQSGAKSVAAWKSENYCGDLRADAVAGTTSRRRAPEIWFPTGPSRTSRSST